MIVVDSSKQVTDEFGLSTVSIVHQQGCPSVVFALQGLDQVQGKLVIFCLYSADPSRNILVRKLAPISARYNSR